MPRQAGEAVAIISNHVQFDASKSPEGSRAWERLPELPTPEEVNSQTASSDELPWFPLNQKWDSKAQYLEAVYSILRFEGVEGLRYSVKCLRDNPSMMDDDNTCVYTKVRVKGYLFPKMGPLARVSFSTKRAGAQIKWTQSKRLQAGKIVALSTDHFKTDCRIAVVGQRPVEGGLDQNPPVVDIQWADAKQAAIDPGQELVMVEARSGYFESVRHALKGLQMASREWSPLEKYVVSLNDNDLPSSANPRKIDLSPLVDHISDQMAIETNADEVLARQALSDVQHRFSALDVSTLQSELKRLKNFTSLDDSQLDAVVRIVSKELAIIQGPPGTGKTFTSVKALKVLMDNRQPGDPPIIVAAQTNHALDQLLLYCRSAGANIMRVGGRTENEDIAERTIYELRMAAGRLQPSGRIGAICRERDKAVSSFTELVAGVFGGAELLDPDNLLQANVISQEQFDSLVNNDWETTDEASPMETWLGPQKIERLRQQTEDLDFETVEAVDEVEVLEELDANFNDDQVEDDNDRIHGAWVELSSHFTGQRPQIANWERRCREMLKRKNLFDIPREYRGGVYQLLEMDLRESEAKRFRSILAQTTRLAMHQKMAGWTRDLHIIDKHCIDIMGCTTTGLTKYRGFLAAMKPRILLIEEAAETREANITSALYPSIQQLILVGDHQQLPPSCDIARLAKEPYNLNVSLFERLVENNLAFTMLNHQRRMAPELRYIVQKFYPALKDHPLVNDLTERAYVPGMGTRRSWFFTHSWPEQTDADNSKFNQEEVEMVVAFIRYLMYNNVKASQITVLTYYKGQKRKILQRLRKEDIPRGNFFNVATIDSYQGEENEIVLLSLVRSPQPGRNYNVGFLDSQNRATVAISRARRGFYMFGNKQNLLDASYESRLTWGPIWNGFAEQSRVAMSKGLPLVCEPHKNEIWIKNVDDWVGNAGGCKLKCSGRLNCGHECKLTCHTVSHDIFSCKNPCTKTLECGHKCQGYCSDPCRCAEDCPEFVQLQVARHLAELQMSEQPRLAASDMLYSRGSSESPTKQQAPKDWQNLARDPQTHDNMLREARQKHNVDIGDTAAALKQALDRQNIQEVFVPVSNIDCRRVTGRPQNIDVRRETQEKKVVNTVGRLEAIITSVSRDPQTDLRASDLQPAGHMLLSSDSRLLSGHTIPALDGASSVGTVIGFGAELSKANNGQQRQITRAFSHLWSVSKPQYGGGTPQTAEATGQTSARTASQLLGERQITVDQPMGAGSEKKTEKLIDV